MLLLGELAPTPIFPTPEHLELQRLRRQVLKVLGRAPNYPLFLWVGHYGEKTRTKVHADLQASGWAVEEERSADVPSTAPASWRWGISPSHPL